jgi:hypothetical protein
MGINLTNLLIDQTFQQLTQISGSVLTDGTGSAITNLDISASFATEADNASTSDFAQIAISSSYATVAGTAISASYAPTVLPAGLVSGSSQIDVSLTTGNLTGSRVDGEVALAALATSSSYAGTSLSSSYAATAPYNGLLGVVPIWDQDTTGNAATATSALTSTSSSHALNADTSISSSFATNAVSALTSISSSHALVADLATTASYVDGQELFAKTNVNNTFGGDQTFNSINAVSASIGHINYVTGSATIIGDAFIVLNADTPTLQFAGIKVFDSGSATTASFEWNGDTDFWTVVEEGGLSANLITGPLGLKGSEAVLITGRIPKSGVENQLLDSNISDDGSTVTIGGDLVADTITANTNFSGNLIGNASTATTASYALNGGTDLLPLNNNWTGINNFNNSVNLNQGANLPYDNGVKQLNVGLSGSAQASLSGFDFNGKVYGKFATNGSGGFNIEDNFIGTGSQIYIKSDNGTVYMEGLETTIKSNRVNIQAKTPGALNSIRVTDNNHEISLSQSPSIGISGISATEATEVFVTLNAYDDAGTFDNGLLLKTNISGSSFSDYDLPSYNEVEWLQVPQEGTPSFKRGLEITGSLSVSGDVVCNNPTLFKSRVTADITTGGTTGAVSIDFSLGNFFTITPSGTTTISPSNVDSVKSQTISIVIDNTATQTVSFSGILWAAGTAPTITAGGKDIVTLVSFGSIVYGTAVQNLS